MQPTFSQIRDRIVLAMQHRGFTQRELARRSGLAETQVSVILKRLETRPYAIELETLGRISQGASVSFLWLLTGLDENALSAPPPLRNLPGWEAAASHVAYRVPGLPAWIWEWVGNIRLPDNFGTYPLPSLLEWFLQLARWLFMPQPAPHELPVEEVLTLPPSTRRPRTSKASKPKGKTPVAKRKTRAQKEKLDAPRSKVTSAVEKVVPHEHKARALKEKASGPKPRQLTG